MRTIHEFTCAKCGIISTEPRWVGELHIFAESHIPLPENWMKINHQGEEKEFCSLKCSTEFVEELKREKGNIKQGENDD